MRLPHDWFPEDLPDNVAIGEGSWLYSSYAFRHCRSSRTPAVRIGRDSGVYDGSYFDLGPEGEVEIGDYCTIVGGIFCTNARVIVRDYAFVAHEVVFADGPHALPFDRSVRTAGAGGIELGENCWIGARAILLGGARIGANAVVGAGAVIDGVVPAGATAAGVPARIIGGPSCR